MGSESRLAGNADDDVRVLESDRMDALDVRVCVVVLGLGAPSQALPRRTEVSKARSRNRASTGPEPGEEGGVITCPGTSCLAGGQGAWQARDCPLAGTEGGGLPGLVGTRGISLSGPGETTSSVPWTLSAAGGALGLDMERARRDRADDGRERWLERVSGRVGRGGSGGNPPGGIGGTAEGPSCSLLAVSTMSRASALVAACRAEYRSRRKPSGWVKSSKSHRRSSRSRRRFSMEAGREHAT